MEAVRLRKEGQIVEADNQRTMALRHGEERARRENMIMSDFRELLAKKQREADRKLGH
jgi:hypothetical protein